MWPHDLTLLSLLQMIGGKGQKGVVGVVEGRGVGGAALLHFPRATHDLQGTYKCIASNFAGTAQKTFNLLVQGNQKDGQMNKAVV